VTDRETSIDIVTALKVDEELVEAIARLIRQLSKSSSIPTVAQLNEIVRADCTTLLLARDLSVGGHIIGMLTLAVFRIPTGVRAWIEDVAVDASARGKGVGESLSREALRIAEAKGARTVELSSRPSREAANRLYRRLGFLPRETNVYRFNIDKQSADERL
jgi:ribosomal protein S18 acetylase RimI-like enzyme